MGFHENEKGNITGERSILVTCLPLLLVVVVLSTGNAQERKSIEGVVLNERNEPLAGANVVLLQTGLGAVAGEDGKFAIRFVPKGSYTLKVSMVGYESREIRNVVPGEAKALRIVLREEPIPTGTVEVTSRRTARSQSDTRTSVQAMKPREVKNLPGAAEDVLRSLQALPGVLSPNDFSSQLIVRGSGPDQNLILMDEVEIFNPYRLYGVVSMFNPETVSEISLITGGFPAKYGDRLSAVLDVKNREGAVDANFHANLNTSLTNANLVLEGRTGIGDQGAWLFSSRRTYYDLIIGPIVKNLKLVDGDVSFPNFTDVQARLSFGPFEGHKFFVNAVASRDGVDIVSGAGRTNPDSVTVFNTTYNYTSSLTWNWVPSSSQLNSVTLSWYRNDGRTVFEGWVLDPALNRDEFKDIQNDSLKALIKLFNLNFYSDFSIQKFSLKDNYSLSHAWGLFETGFGVEWITGDLFFKLDMDDELKALIQSNPRHSAIVDQTKQVQNYAKLYTYVQNRFAIGERLHVLPGLRLDYYGLIDRIVVSPRLQFSYALGPLTTIRSSWGAYYQSPGYEKLVDQRQFFDFTGGNLNGLRPEKAIHYILGIDRWLDEKWLVNVEGYYKDFTDLIVQQKYTTRTWEASLTNRSDPHNPSSWTAPYQVERDSLTAVPVNGSWGEAYGLEFTLEKRNKSVDDRLSGWVTYALAWAQRYRDGAVIPFNYDQRHTVNIVMNYSVNDWLTLGAYWRFGTNFPYTEPVGVRARIVRQDGTPTIATDFAGKAILDVDYGNESNINQERLPLYHRLDFRATARTLFWGMRWEFYLDIINVYNHKNIIQYQFFVQSDGSLGRRDIGMFPIVPTIGFSARF